MIQYNYISSNLFNFRNLSIWFLSQFFILFLLIKLEISLLSATLGLSFLSLIFVLFQFNQSKKFLHDISCYFSSLNLVISLLMLFSSSQIHNSFFSQQKYTSFLNTSHLDSLLGFDGISLVLILLTNLSIFLCILNIDYKKTKKLSLLLVCLFLLQWAILASFSIQELFGFFIVFETTLIPIYYLVIEWGSRERKVRAGYLISLYTFFGSIFMLFTLIYLYNKTNVTNQMFLTTLDLSINDQLIFWSLFFIALAAKIPTFPLHIWLPEAHVEAPTLGSVILAALLLKLGTYGLIRFVAVFFPHGNLFNSGIVSTLAIISILYTSLTAIRQIDLKKIIAYSSIGHMNAVLLGILLLGLENLEGAIFQKLSHGIVSGALFFCIGSFYKRYKVRSLKYLGGFMQTYPILSVIFLIFSMANISFPGTSSFVGEFVIFLGLISQNTLIVFLASINMITGAVYMLYALNRVIFGNLKNLFIQQNLDLDRSEFYLYFILIYFLFLLGLQPNFIFNWLHIDCANIIEHIKLQVQ